MKEFLDFSFAIIISTSNKLPELVFAGVVYCVLECYKYLWKDYFTFLPQK